MHKPQYERKDKDRNQYDFEKQQAECTFKPVFYTKKSKAKKKIDTNVKQSKEQQAQVKKKKKKKQSVLRPRGLDKAVERMKIARERKKVLKQMVDNNYINANKYRKHEIFDKKITNLKEKKRDSDDD